MLYEYESVFYPEGADGWNNRWITNEVRFLPTEKLVEQYLYYQQVLDIHRCKEPAKKRKNKSEYKTWIRLTHAFLDALHDIYTELEKRKTCTQ